MPSKCKLVYLSPAQNDFEEIVRFHILNVGGASARRISAVIENTVGRLADFPLMGQTHPDPVLAANGFRKLVLTETYVAIYKVIDGAVYLYRIVNGATDYPRLLK